MPTRQRVHPCFPPIYGAASIRPALRRLLAETLNRLLIRLLVDPVHVPVDEVHVRLQHCRQLARVIGFDQHETGPTTREGVPAADLLRVVKTSVVRRHDSLTDLIDVGPWLPFKAAVPKHFLSLPRTCPARSMPARQRIRPCSPPISERSRENPYSIPDHKEGNELSEQKRRPFVLGRRCPDNNFKQSVARQLRMLSLVADADYIDQLDTDHPSVSSLFGINNALQDQERGAPFIPGEHQWEFLDRLADSDHTPTEALDGLIAVGIADMARAHREHLWAAERESSSGRPEVSARSPQDPATADVSAAGSPAAETFGRRNRPPAPPSGESGPPTRPPPSNA